MTNAMAQRTNKLLGHNSNYSIFLLSVYQNKFWNTLLGTEDELCRIIHGFAEYLNIEVLVFYVWRAVERKQQITLLITASSIV